LLGLTGSGPRLVITDLGILEPDPVTCELTLTHVHPGVRIDQVRDATSWGLAVSGYLAVTEQPRDHELATLRALGATTHRVRGAA
jgi:glutaconate CoA-transferase subunit B